MGKRVRLVAGAIGAVLVVAAAAVAIGRATFERRIADEVAALFAASEATAGAVVTEADLAGLPEPVRRWLRWARVVGTERPTPVRLRMGGEFRLGEGRGWLPFTAEEYYTTNPPGFVWSVEMELAPLVPIVGRDRYAGGEGSIEMRLLGVVSVANAAGGDALRQGALLRYLNETMWFPAAVLDPAIAWEPVDRDSARATMRHAGTTVSAVFVFDAEGRPVDMRAERYRMDRGAVAWWSTPLHAWGEFGGVRVPTAGQAIWHGEDGDFPYARLRITDIEVGRAEAY